MGTLKPFPYLPPLPALTTDGSLRQMNVESYPATDVLFQTNEELGALAYARRDALTDDPELLANLLPYRALQTEERIEAARETTKRFASACQVEETRMLADASVAIAREETECVRIEAQAAVEIAREETTQIYYQTERDKYLAGTELKKKRVDCNKEVAITLITEHRIKHGFVQTNGERTEWGCW